MTCASMSGSHWRGVGAHAPHVCGCEQRPIINCLIKHQVLLFYNPVIILLLA